MKLQAFERFGNVGVGLAGEDDMPEKELKQVLYNFHPKRQLSREEYMRELSFSYSASVGDNDPIDWDDMPDGLEEIVFQ